MAEASRTRPWTLRTRPGRRWANSYSIVFAGTTNRHMRRYGFPPSWRAATPVAPTRRDAEDAAAPDGATRERHAANRRVALASAGSQPARGFDVEESGFQGKWGGSWPFPSQELRRPARSTGGARRIARSYRVLRGRAVRRGSAYSALCLVGRTEAVDPGNRHGPGGRYATSRIASRRRWSSRRVRKSR